MNLKNFAAAAATAVSALALSSSAFAQAPAAAPALGGGPALPGVCIINIEGAIGASTVGKYVNTRLQQIGAQVQAELNAERTGIENDGKQLEAERGKINQATLEQRSQALQVRINALQRKAQVRDREMQATEQKALQRVGEEMDPLIRQAYQQKNCSILLQRGAVVLGNPSMDITQQVITALNAKITQFPFDREHLEEAGAPPVATVPAPARPAPRRK